MMRVTFSAGWVWCTLLLLAFISSATSTNWELVGSSPSLAVSVDGVDQGDGAFVYDEQAGVYTLDWGDDGVDVTWFDPPREMEFSSLSTKQQAFLEGIQWNTTYADSIEQVAPDLYLAAWRDNIPYVTYFSSEVQCALTLRTSRETFDCWEIEEPTAAASSYSLRVAPQVLLADTIHVTSPFAATDSTSIVFDALTLAILREHEHAFMETETSAIEHNNADRKSSSRIAVGFLWTFVSLGCAFLGFVACVWQTWLWPGCQCCLQGLEKRGVSMTTAVVLWFLLHVALTIPILVVSGLGGFLCVVTFEFLFSLAVNINYCCKRSRANLQTTVQHRFTTSHYQPAANANANANAKAKANASARTEMTPAKNRKETDGSTDNVIRIRPKSFDLDGGAEVGADTRHGGDGSKTSSSGTLTNNKHTENTNGRGGGSSTIELDEVGVALEGGMGEGGWDSSFTRSPHRLGWRQKKLLKIGAVCSLLAVVVSVAIFGLWSVPDYILWQRYPLASTGKQGLVVEYIPEMIAKSVLSVYAFEGYATRLKMNNVFFDVTTEWCGEFYSQILRDSDKYDSIYVEFILKYDIDMSIYEREDYMDYVSVNDWFTRGLKAGARPISQPSNAQHVVSPADARVHVFPQVPRDSAFWIKGEDFTVQELVGYSYAPYEDAAMAIVRLAPQDYHRYHAPVGGTVSNIQMLEGSLHSVNSDGMTSGNYAIFNQRTVIDLETAEMGRVSVIAIGAMCVGSVYTEFKIGDPVAKGQELGFFQFGGSTVVLVFEKGSLAFDEDLLLHSAQGVENLMMMGMQLGVKKT